jgi:hypothetical protein
MPRAGSSRSRLRSIAGEIQPHPPATAQQRVQTECFAPEIAGFCSRLLMHSRRLNPGRSAQCLPCCWPCTLVALVALARGRRAAAGSVVTAWLGLGWLHPTLVARCRAAGRKRWGGDGVACVWRYGPAGSIGDGTRTASPAGSVRDYHELIPDGLDRVRFRSPRRCGSRVVVAIGRLHPTGLACVPRASAYLTIRMRIHEWRRHG